jgi:hypothetical protein
MPASGTLIETPSDDWWRKVFTEAEYEALESSFAKIVDEFFNPDDDGEPISVVVMVSRTKFMEQLRVLAMAQSDGYDVEDIGIAFAQEYFDNNDIPFDTEGSRNATEFYTPFDEEEPDDDD